MTRLPKQFFFNFGITGEAISNFMFDYFLSLTLLKLQGIRM